MSMQFSNVGGVIVLQNQRKVIMNNIEYDMPKGMRGNNVATINGKSYIDGFELINEEWKRTLKALWYKMF